MNAANYAAQQAARKVATDALRATHPHLVSAEGNSLTAAAKNIRTELQRAFPGVKFSVRSRRFSGGDALDVRWTDGPTRDMVETITGKYQAGSFDGMTDCYNYEHSAWRDAFGDAKYVQEGRDYSDAFIARAIQYLQTKYSNPELRVSVEDFRTGKLWSVRFAGGIEDVQSLIHRTLSKRAACVPVAA